MGKRQLLLILAVFIATRGIGVFLAANERFYGTSYAHITHDPSLYRDWADDIMHEDMHPYSGVRIEYPPGVMPFAILPDVGGPSLDDYLLRFILLMVVVDAAAFVGLILLARRHGSMLGPWAWIAGTVLLGPIIFTRLDLIPAAATIWALERASAQRWFASGGWLSFGALAKVYPIVLMPLALAAAAKRRALVSGIALVAGLVLLPYIGSLQDLYHSVFGFHSSRGIHVESSWGALLMIANRLGYDMTVGVSYGAFHIDAGLSEVLKTLGNLLPLAALSIGTWLTVRWVDRGDAPRLAAAMYGTLAVILGLGTVFSPQFVTWLIALAAVALCAPTLHLKAPLLTLLPVALVTQIIYPFIYDLLLVGNPSAIAVLVSRNLLVLIAGFGTWSALRYEDRTDAAPLTPGPWAPSDALAFSGS